METQCSSQGRTGAVLQNLERDSTPRFLSICPPPLCLHTSSFSALSSRGKTVLRFHPTILVWQISSNLWKKSFWGSPFCLDAGQEQALVCSSSVCLYRMQDGEVDSDRWAARRPGVSWCDSRWLWLIFLAVDVMPGMSMCWDLMRMARTGWGGIFSVLQKFVILLELYTQLSLLCVDRLCGFQQIRKGWQG